MGQACLLGKLSPAAQQLSRSHPSLLPAPSPCVLSVRPSLFPPPSFPLPFPPSPALCPLSLPLSSHSSIPLPASSEYQVWLGRNNLFEDEASAQHRFVSKSFLHPDFNLDLLKNTTQNQEKDFSNDLMLLRLAQPAEITDSVKVISLPSEEPTLGSTCLASGWGSIEPINCKSGPNHTAWRGTPGSEGEENRARLCSPPSCPRPTVEYPDDLQCVDLELLPNKNCAEAHIYLVTDSMLCAGDMEGGKDTCVVSGLLPAMWGRADRGTSES